MPQKDLIRLALRVMSTQASKVSSRHPRGLRIAAAVLVTEAVLTMATSIGRVARSRPWTQTCPTWGALAFELHRCESVQHSRAQRWKSGRQQAAAKGQEHQHVISGSSWHRPGGPLSVFLRVPSKRGGASSRERDGSSLAFGCLACAPPSLHPPTDRQQSIATSL